MHKLTLLKKEVAALYTANKTFFKRRRTKKRRLQNKRLLTINESKALKALKNPVKPEQAEIGKSSSRTKRRKTGEKRYNNCGGTGYNAKIYKIIFSSDKETESD
jgi:hypothetical protein